MGGWQGSVGKFAFLDYTKGSAFDRIAEAYSGPHDMLNSLIWYDALGNIKSGVAGTPLGTIGDIANYTNVLLATPVALPNILPPGVLEAIRAAQKSSSAKEHK